MTVTHFKCLSGNQSKYYEGKQIDPSVDDRSRGLSQLAIDNRKMICIDDCSQIPRFQSSDDKDNKVVTRNIICSPIIVSDKVFGVIYALNVNKNLLQEGYGN